MQEKGALTRLPGRAAAAPVRMPQVRVPMRLDSRAKAAIVVRLLLGDGADLPLEDLPDDLQARLTQQMGRMGLIDRVTLASVAQEFSEALDSIGLAFPPGLAGALSVLDGRISPQTAARLRKEAGIRAAGNPWARLRALAAAELAELATGESVEVAAVLLSKLDTARAAELLGRLPGPLARRIALAVSRTGAVTPATVERIGLALASRLDDRPVPAFDRAPGERVGAILNESPSAMRDEVLNDLDQADAVFASSVRRAIFTFAHIPARVARRDVPKLVRAANPADLVLAIAAATEGDNAAAAEFLLANMSGRLADTMREEAAEKGRISPRDGEAAMTAIAAAVRGLVQSGDITLLPPDAPGE